MSFNYVILHSGLEKVASALEFRLNSAFTASVTAPRYDPLQEVERSEEVDAACVLVATEVAQPGRRQPCNVAFRVRMEIAELVLWRIRDAQRYLRDFPRAWSKGSDAKTNLRQLLVESWHTYAERYWLERRENSEACTAGSVRFGT